MKKFFTLFVFLLLIIVQVSSAQTRRTKGKVLDESGRGFPGAGVTVKNSQTGTVTDIDGNFVLDIPEGNNVLVIQAIGYGTQEVNVTGGNVVVRMTTSSKVLQGAVITALGIKREKRELGYATTTLSNQDITVANNVSALSSLEGKVPGANVTTTTGGPGGSVSVVLRGDKSLLGNNQAILIVDGIIINNYDRTISALGNIGVNSSNFNNLSQVDFGNSGNDIDPEDIESLTVLEGPAAAALYGSIASTGAIIITTKKGSSAAGKNKLHVTYKMSYTLSDVLKYPDLQNQFGQGSLYGGGDWVYNPSDNFSWGLPFDGQLRPWGQIINGKQEVKPYSAIPNNIKDFFNIGQTLNNYASISGGTETSNYFLSLNAINNTGIVPNTNYTKYSVRFNGGTQLTHTIYSNISFNYINLNSKAEAQGQSAGSVYNSLTQQPRDIPISELANNNNPFVSFNTLSPTGVPSYGYYGAFTSNPYYLANNYNNNDKVDRIISGMTLGIKPVSTNLNIYDRIGVDVAADRTTYQGPSYNVQAYPQDLNFAPYNANYSPAVYSFFPHVSQGYLLQNNLNDLQMNNDVVVDYAKPLSDKINIDVLAGNNVRLIQQNYLVSYIDPATNGLVLPGFYSFTNAQGPVQVINYLIQQRQVGVYGDFKINYDKKLFLEMTARNDWTSTLMQGSNSYFYPSVGGSYVFTEDIHNNWVKKILDYGKIRASYASTGNGAPAYANNNPAYVRSIIPSAFGSVVFPFSGNPGYLLTTSIGDPSLRSERTNSYEAGADLSFFKDHINFSFTYYNGLSQDQIVSIPVALSSGFASQTINVGTISNKGVELYLKVTPIHTRSGFRWDLFGSYTKNVNEVVSLANGVSQITVGGFSGMSEVAQVGKPYGAFYSTDIQRNSNGQVVVDPATGLPLTTANAVYGGSYQPRFIASWGTDLSYKGFTLHALFTTKQGGVYFSETKNVMDFSGVSAETAYNNRNPYVFPNSVIQTGPNTYAPNTTKFQPYSYYTFTEQFTPGQDLVDASYIKLSELSLSYALPEKMVSHTAFSKIEVSLFGNNLFLWTPKSNQFDDPSENSGGGITNIQNFNFLARPSMRNYGASIKVIF